MKRQADMNRRKLKGLVLSAKLGDRVLIQLGDHSVWVGVQSYDRNQVSLVFDGPKEVGIFREQLLQGAMQCPQM